MRDELLAYLLDDLGAEERARVQARLESDPIWQHELERLRQCMKAYDADPKGEACPPGDLVNRTCSFVQKAVKHFPGTTGGPTLLPASLTESRDPSSSRRRWSRADLAVGGGIFLALVMLVLPALIESRAAARRLSCQNKLHDLGTALGEYAEQLDGQLPQIGPGENTGIFVIELADQGILTREQLVELLVCPSSQLADDVFSGRAIMRIPTRDELSGAPELTQQQWRERMSGSFAYRIGYLSREGVYHHVKFTGTSNAPLLADAPSFSIAGFQSANHGGCGQNVLYQDLSARYNRQCLGNDHEDHMFLNANLEQAPGRHLRDVVLLRSEVVPVRQIVRRRGR